MEPDLLLAILQWERALLTMDSLADWLAAAADPPGTDPQDRRVSVLLADPTYELRHLAAGVQAPPEAVVPLTFVDTLTGRAPQVAALHRPWFGAYRAADHGLVLPAESGLSHILMLPLQRGGQLAGACIIATRGDPPAMAQTDTVLLEHVCAVIGASLERHFDRARLLRGGIVDSLTGWHSARYLQARLHEEIARCQRHGGSVACLVLDVDRLQSINDARGQAAGDRALTELAARIEGQVRSCDTAARLGSDEFAVLMPATDAAGAAPLARRILAAVDAARFEIAEGVVCDLGLSIGIASLAPAPTDDRKAVADQLIADALAAMHRVKQRGGGGFEIAV
jgi:diguanylate cyclase (GGDEF)-like protein